MNRESSRPEVVAQPLLETPTVVVRDVCCRGTCRPAGEEEAARALHLVFPYRGLYVRHLGQDDAVAEANQVLFFNPHEGYRVSHPIAGGDASLDLVIGEPLLRELAPRAFLQDGPALGFRQQRLRIDPRAQALVALLRHSLRRNIAETLEAESLALTLVRRAVGAGTTHAPGASAGRRRLVDRIKLILASDLARRWTLAEIAAETGHSPVYLTQVFRQVEGTPPLPLPAAAAARAGPRSSRPVRRPDHPRPRPRVLQPQPFHDRVPPGLRPLALRVPARRAAPLARLSQPGR
jgi:AraC-like DNA-binding protein